MTTSLQHPRQRPLRRALVAVVLLSGTLVGGSLAHLPSVAAAPRSGCAASFPAYDRATTATGSTTQADVPVEMSDGTVIRLDLTLPTGAGTRFPAIVTITGYGKSSPIGALGGGGSGLVGRGYARITVDDRGTGTSGGQWDSWGPRTVRDYVEVLDWITAQPWSDGRIGLTGGSYMGITSLYAAAQGHPAVKAVFATVPMGDAYRDIVFGGGQANVAFIPLWMGLVTALGLTPGASADVLADHLLGLVDFQTRTLLSAVMGGDAAFDGPFWRQRSPIEVADRITAPTFIVGGLDDIFQRGEPMLYERLADHTDARLLLGPWTHVAAGTGLPRDGVPPLGQLELQWFDQHILGLDAGVDCIPPVTQFVRGHERYESTTSWPAPGLRAQRWFLRGSGGLTADAPTVVEPGGSFSSILPTGICSRSTAQWLLFALEGSSCQSDNRLGEIGALTFTSAPFTEETVINGPIQADVWITTDRPEASVSVAISDVAPDGTSRGLTNGLLLASHRAIIPSKARLLDGQSIQPWHPFTKEAVLAVTPGEPTLLPIEVFPTSAAIAPGHRLRVTVAPYDLPHALPPLDPGITTVGANVRVLTEPGHESSVVFPVASGATTALSSSDATGFSLAGGSSTGGAVGPTDHEGPAELAATARSLPAANQVAELGGSPVVAWLALALVTGAAAGIARVRQVSRRRVPLSD